MMTWWKFVEDKTERASSRKRGPEPRINYYKEQCDKCLTYMKDIHPQYEITEEG